MNKTLFFLALLTVAPLHNLFAQEPLWQLKSESGLTLSIYSQLVPVQINQIHSWELVLSQADGKAVTGASIGIEGGMPVHDHGLPTLPQVTSEIAAGRYLLEGMRFHMPGQWQLFFLVNAGGRQENFQLDFSL